MLNINVLGTNWTVKLLAQNLVNNNTPGSVFAISGLSANRHYVTSRRLTRRISLHEVKLSSVNEFLDEIECIVKHGTQSTNQ